MKRPTSTVEDLESFTEQLNGPLGVALRSAGVVIERRMHERGVTWDDLSDQQVADLFISAFMETAPRAYSHIERGIVENAVAGIAKSIRMELSATVDGSKSIN